MLRVQERSLNCPIGVCIISSAINRDSALNRNVRQDSGKAHSPETEIIDGRPDPAVRVAMEILQYRHQQSEKPLTWLGWRQDVFTDLGHIIQRQVRRVLTRQCKLRFQHVAGIQVDQFPILSLVIRHRYPREPFKA